MDNAGMPSAPPTQPAPYEVADLVVTWSGVVLAGFALLVSILTILFAAAGFLGIRELRSIRAAGARAKAELAEHRTVAEQVIDQAGNAVRVAESLSTEARTLIERERDAVERAEEHLEHVRNLKEQWEASFRDLDSRMTTQVEVSHLFIQGEADYREGRYERAVENLRRAVDLDPKNPRVRYRFGRTLTNIEENESAEEQFDAAVELGLVADAERGLAHLFRYIEPDRALRHANCSVGAARDNAHNWNTLGLILRDNGQFDRSREAHIKANDLDGALVTTPFYLALLAARAQALPHARDRAAEAVSRLAVGERKGRIKPLWAALIRWTDHVLRGAYDDADGCAEVVRQFCPSARRAREVSDHMELLLRSLSREMYRDRYVAIVENGWQRSP